MIIEGLIAKFIEGIIQFQSWIRDTVVADFEDDFLVDREAPLARYVIPSTVSSSFKCNNGSCTLHVNGDWLLETSRSFHHWQPAPRC